MTSGRPIPPEEIFERKNMVVEYIGNTIRATMSGAALSCGVVRTTLYQWLKEDPEFKKRVDEAIVLSNEAAVDWIEQEFFSAVKRGNIQAILYALKTICKHRGWEEKANIVFEGNMKVTHDASREYIVSKLISGPPARNTAATIEQPNTAGDDATAVRLGLLGSP